MMTNMRVLTPALAVLLTTSAAAQQPTAAQQSARQSNMALTGYNDLQNRSAYQPVIQKQGNRWIAYIGHHAGVQLNPLTGQQEENGTSVVDVTDPARPRYLAHIPGESSKGPGEGGGGGAQMVRVCSGGDLPRADKSKFYMLRAYGASAHEMWDVTDPAKPSRLNVIVGGLRDTHKSWWECDTGIAYLVGGVVGWRTPRMSMIYDLSDPASPKFIRYFGLPGQQPGARGPTPESMHGPISNGPKGNRVYFAYGNSRDGVLEIVDREKLLNGPKEPTDDNLRYPIVSRLDFPEDVGAHNIVPLLHMQLSEFAKQRKGGVKDFVAVIGETVANECQEFRQTMRMVDVSEESKPTPVSTWTVPEDGGNFCTAGGRFGAHSTNENFPPVYYNRVLFVAHFNAGVRAVDVRDPFHPKEIGYYIPAITDKTDKRCVGQGADQKCKVAIQTNNVEVDDRGYIYIVDRANTGMHILSLTGPARQVADFSQAVQR
ncbi:MAG TPA: hypothetical protein VN841_20490 [Bryobacteraceae bacterium]|nr:hypothetical protein [Bryobacteraceae bacterium]